MVQLFVLVGRDVDPWGEEKGSPSRLSLGGWGADGGEAALGAAPKPKGLVRNRRGFRRRSSEGPGTLPPGQGSPSSDVGREPQIPGLLSSW